MATISIFDFQMERESRFEDMWAPYRDIYPEPTTIESYLISKFLNKFTFEDENFVEDEDQRWTCLKNHVQCLNLRQLLIEHLRQVREGKGYDVDLSLCSIGAVFLPMDEAYKELYGDLAAEFAIEKIASESGKTYELVCLDRGVWVNVVAQPLLMLTFTAKEKEKEKEKEIQADLKKMKTFQAMVSLFRKNPKPVFFLLEWTMKI